MNDFRYIDRDDELVAFCSALAERSEWLGVDTEFVREKTYYPQLCLVQIASDAAEIACIDMRRITDLAPLRDLLSSPAVKVLHAARQDIEVLYQTLDCLPRPVFDTQLAASLCGHGDQVGYGALVEAITGVRLGKAHARTDWRHRPIPPDALAYAADDVRYLGDLYRQLGGQLDASGRRDWFEAEIALLTDGGLYQSTPADAWRRVRGTRGITTAASWGALRALATWREYRAMDKNRPRRWIARDETLVELARRAPTSADQLTDITGIRGLLKAHCADALLDAVAEGRDQPVKISPRPTLTPEQRDTARRLSQIVHARARQLQMSQPLLASRKQVERLVLGERDLALLTGWRRDVIGEELLAAAEDESSPGGSDCSYAAG